MSNLVKAAAVLAGLSSVGHLAMGLNELFPFLDHRIPGKHPLRTAAKIGWLEGVGYYVLNSILLWKVAKEGQAGHYERLMLLTSFIQGIVMGYGFVQGGKPFPPLVPLWGGQALLGAAYLRGGV